MDTWKRAVVAGSLGAATVMFMKGKHPAGILAGGIALAVLAAEYPDRFEEIRRALPSYFDRGMRVIEMAGRAGKHFADASENGGHEGWEQIGI